MTKVIDYIGVFTFFLAMGTLGMESGIYLGGQFCLRYVIPMATRHMVQSSLKGQGGVSFFVKMQSAQPVPFLPQSHGLVTTPPP